MYYFSQPETKAQKHRKALKAVAKLSKTINNIQHIDAFNGAIAKTFWGKSWCDNLERYADYGNRLPRGRSYLRAGCVCHLALEQGKITAKISGSSSSIYTVTVSLTPVKAAIWENLCHACVGKTGTLLELLKGKISKEIMELMCHEEHGLFPQEDELLFTCSCPDGAYMCKHVAAALYGIGRRLDTEPEILFTLRGVSAKDLIGEQLDFNNDVTNDEINQDLGALFGIDLDMSNAPPIPEPEPIKTTTKKPKKTTKKPTKAAIKKIAARFDVAKATGDDIRALRLACDLSLEQFAHAADVTPATVKRWEKIDIPIQLRYAQRQRIKSLHDALVNHIAHS